MFREGGNMKIKVGDIFYDNRGITSFYQVVQIYKSGRIRIREIEKIETPTGYEGELKAAPIPDKFKPNTKYDKNNKHPRIKNNDKGTIKVVQQFSNGDYYINFYTGWADFYKGEPVISNYWIKWMN